MPDRIYVGTKPHHRDALGERVRTRIAQDLGIGTVISVRTAAVYAINGSLSGADLTALAEGPYSDPIIQDTTINSSFCFTFDWMVEVGFRPGVTDNVGRTAREAAAVTLKNLPSEISVHTGMQYFLEGNLTRRHVERIARELLANELINTVRVYTKEEWLAVHAGDFPAPVVVDTHPIVPFRPVNLEVTDDELMRISKEGMLALTLEEMKIIRDHYRTPGLAQKRSTLGLPPGPTDMELEIFAQTWSEHCKHKIFNARITYYEDDRHPQTISSLFKVYIQRATESVRNRKGDRDICLSVFKDNAGVIRFNDTWAVSFKVETHNSPSALDPYGGALTGIVGVNRDPFGTGIGCRLIANTDVFCFASPFYDKEIPVRILHPKRVMEGVREGVEHGGNKSGIPTINGTVVFDDRFLGKPLVYCGTLGIVPLVVNGRPGYEKRADKGDRIIMVGGRIGKDGIHGATFSSEPLHEGSPATAVQIGDPITQKRMTDFLLRARDLDLYTAITDNGAGGLSSSVGEMARDTNGAVIHLDRAPLKYHGLEPWEIFLSEAQERMTVAVSPNKLDTFLTMAKQWSVEATDLGEFTDSGFLIIYYKETVVGLVSMEMLHEGLPQMNLNARWKSPLPADPAPIVSNDPARDLIGLVRRLNICSKEYIIRQYDHEVQGGSVVKPLVGARNDGPSDAAVIRPLLDSFEGIAVSNGIAPRYSDIDTYAMTACAFDEAVRNAVCTGADPDHMAALDNFCWCDPVAGPGNPDGEYKLAQLVRANQALFDMCNHYEIPLVSGKDSMKNDYHIGTTRISIPPTVLVSIVAKVPDVRESITMDFKRPGSLVYLTGITHRDLGASEYLLMRGITHTSVPTVRRPAACIALYRAVHRAIRRGLVLSAHDASDGGLGVAVAEMCFSGECGVRIDLARVGQSGCTTDAEILFSESPGRLLLEISPEHVPQIESLFEGMAFACIGQTTKGDIIECIGREGNGVMRVSRIDVKSAWKSTLAF